MNLYCYCGRALIKNLIGEYICSKHKDRYLPEDNPRKEKTPRKRARPHYSGKSNSVNAYNDYQ